MAGTYVAIGSVKVEVEYQPTVEAQCQVYLTKAE
jgi:hypothetical protein